MNLDGLQSALTTIFFSLCACLLVLGVVAFAIIRFTGRTLFGLWDSSVDHPRGSSKDASALYASRRERGRSRLDARSIASFGASGGQFGAQSAPPQAGFGQPPQAGFGQPPQAGFGQFGAQSAPAGYTAPGQPPPFGQQPPPIGAGGFGQPPQAGFGQFGAQSAPAGYTAPGQPPPFGQQPPPIGAGGFGQPPQAGFGQFGAQSAPAGYTAPGQPPPFGQQPPPIGAGGFGQPPQAGFGGQVPRRPSLSEGRPYVPPMARGGGFTAGAGGDAGGNLRSRPTLRPRRDGGEIYDDGEDDASLLNFVGF
jgi:hypothetical protein